MSRYLITGDPAGCFVLDTENTTPPSGTSLGPQENAVVVIKFGCWAKGNHTARLCFYTSLTSKCVNLKGKVEDVVFRNNDDESMSMELITNVSVENTIPIAFKVENPLETPLEVNCMFSGNGWVNFKKCPYEIPEKSVGIVEAEIKPSLIGLNRVDIKLQLSTGSYSWYKTFPVFIATKSGASVDIVPENAGAGNGSGGCSITSQGSLNGVSQLLLLLGLLPLKLRKRGKC